MDANTFITELERIPVEIRQMQSTGISDDYIQDLLNSYRIRKKEHFQLVKDPIFDLVQNYDMSQIQIGAITFDDQLEEISDYRFFGKVEVDDLAIIMSSGNVLMLENGSDHIIYKCAQNSSKFLDAIVTAAGFLEKRSVDDNMYDDEILTCKIAEECAVLAGGLEYIDFYKMLLGCDT